MPVYYSYIKSGGTATGNNGRYAARKTGSWSTAFTDPSQYYDSITSWQTSATIADGDIVYISNLHNKSTTLTSTGYVGESSTDLHFYCVDDTNLNLLSTGAKETYLDPTYSYYLFLIQCNYCYGVTFAIEGNAYFIGVQYGYRLYSTFEKCTFEFITNVSTKQHSLNVCPIYFKECVFDFKSKGYIKPDSGEHTFIGCTFISTVDNTHPIFSNINALSGTTGIEVKLIACDFSQANRPVFESGINLYQPSALPRQFIVDRCFFATNSKAKLPTNAPRSLSNKFVNSSPSDFELEPCYDSYYKHGKVVTTISTYREGGANYKFEFDEDINFYKKIYPFSFQVTTYDSCNYDYLKGIRFKLVDFRANFTSLVTLTIFFATIGAPPLFTNKNFYFDIIYPDDTTDRSNFISNMINPFQSETTYPIGGPEWISEGETVFTRQKFSISTTQLGKEGLCSIWVHIFIPNKIIYFCPKVSIS